LALTLAEREEVSRALAAGHSIRSIASLLGRAPDVDSSGRSTVSSWLCQRVLDAREALGRQTQVRRDLGLGGSVTVNETA
jgi:hypothetical protein